MMEPRWDPANQRWEASTGSGKARIWHRSRVPGEKGRAIVLAKLRPPSCEPGSLAWFVESFWWPRVKSSAEPSTIDTYRKTYNNHIRAIEMMQLRDIRLPVLLSLKSQIEIKELSDGSRVPRHPKGIHKIWGVLTAILNLAAKIDGDDGRMLYPYRDHELVELPRIPRRQPGDIATLDPQQLIALVRHLEQIGSRFAGVAYAGGFIGLRRGELAGLKVPHITFSGDLARICISDNRTEFGDKATLKNWEAGEQRVYWVPRYMGEKLLSYAKPNTLYLFTNLDGSPISPNSMSKEFPVAVVAAGLPRIPLKNLRHTSATMLAKAGVPKSDIAEMFGHGDWTVTATHYIGETAELMADRFAGLGADKV